MDQALVAFKDERALVRIKGRGSFKIGSALKQFGEAAVERNVRSILLDMNDCIGMDSTFMGVVAGMASRLKKKNGGQILMVNLSERTRHLLATLGLDQVVQAFEKGQAAGRPDENISSETMQTLNPAAEPGVETTRTMLDAHRQLVDLDPSNEARFKDVLIYLAEDLNRKSEDDTQAS